MSDNTISPLARQYLRLHLANAVGPVLLGRLIRKFRVIDNVLRASAAQLCEVEGVGERRSRAILQSRNDGAVDGEIDKARRVGARIICWEDDNYPAVLRHCDDPPICLYVRGTLLPEDGLALAIVGCRQCTRYGCEQARRFGALLAGAGFSVVSGLARGIDGHAHEGALAANGRTVAVLGCGVDVVYPPEHDELILRVLDHGAILSEDPIGSPPTADSFPRRNRIIAGMSLGTIVIEASKRSGALITAQLATDYNRELFAVPGRVDTPQGAGTNDLIRKGAAKLITCLEDVLDELGDTGRILASPGGSSAHQPGGDGQALGPAVRAALTEEERSILDCLAHEERDLDWITVDTALLPSTVAACITTLQLKGLVIALPGSRFALRKQ